MNQIKFIKHKILYKDKLSSVQSDLHVPLFILCIKQLSCRRLNHLDL